MTKEQEFFLRALADHLEKRNTEPCDGIDWDVLLAIARDQQMEAILYVQVKPFAPKEALSILSRAYSKTFYSYNNRTAFLSVLKEKMAGIPYFVVKGMTIAAYYPYPPLRAMGDTDITVHPEDRERADAVLQSLGCVLKAKEGDKEWHYEKDENAYELHGFLAIDDDFHDDLLCRYFNNCWQYVSNDGTLDDNYHFLYVLLHLRKHIIVQGAGFRQFFDLAALARYQKTLDFTWIFGELSSIGLRQFASVCFALIERWFGVPSPFPAPAAEEDFWEETVQTIFANGVFGAKNIENYANKLLYRQSEKRNVFQMIKNVFKKFLPGYRDLIRSEHYSFLKGKPYLLPAAWIYRIYRFFRYQKTNEAHIYWKSSVAGNKKIRERERVLAAWGLADAENGADKHDTGNI